MQLEYPHTVPADGAVGVDPLFLVLTTGPPHKDSLVVSTKTKAGLVTEDELLPFSMAVWHDTTAVFGDGDVVLGTVVVTVCVHVVLDGAAVHVGQSLGSPSLCFAGVCLLL